MSNLPRIKARFYITADEFEPREITKRLGISPTETRMKSNFPVNTLACAGWVLEIVKAQSKEISDTFNELVLLLYEKAGEIKAICRDYAAETSFTIVVHAVAGNGPEFVISPNISAFAASIGAEISFDIYFYENEKDTGLEDRGKTGGRLKTKGRFICPDSQTPCAAIN